MLAVVILSHCWVGSIGSSSTRALLQAIEAARQQRAASFELCAAQALRCGGIG